MSEKRWYYFSDNKRAGPVSAETIQDLLNAGVLNSNTQVWTYGFEKWQPIKNVDAFHSEYPPAIPRPVTNATTKIEDINFEELVPQIRPWVRYWARLMDYLLFGLFSVSVLQIIYPPALKINDMLLVLLLLLVNVFVESIMLTSWGTTPGKALLRVRLRKSNGQKPTYLEALSRSVSVWAEGWGLGIPIVSPITVIIANKKLKQDGITAWDRRGDFKVSHRQIGEIRVIITVLIFISFVFLFLFSSGLIDQEVHMARGHTYLNKGQYDEATSEFTKAIEINPRCTRAYGNRGVACYHKGQYDQAISDYSKVLEINPRDAKACFNRGLAYNRKGQYDQAIMDCNKALEINPRYTAAYVSKKV